MHLEFNAGYFLALSCLFLFLSGTHLTAVLSHKSFFQLLSNEWKRLLKETEETQVSQHWKINVNSIYLALPSMKGRRKKKEIKKKKIQVPKYFTSWTSRGTAQCEGIPPTATVIHNCTILSSQLSSRAFTMLPVSSKWANGITKI